MDKFFAANGGFLRKVDFEKHTSTWDEPVSVNYRGYDVYELPPNGQGIAALQILNILEGFDLRSLGYNSPQALHLMIEAKKLAFEDRAKFYADPAFAKVPVAELISKKYAEERRKLIDPKRARNATTAGNPALRQGDTIYLTTADSEGNMVSLIQSNYRGMGSGVVVPGLGFGFQDRGEMFEMTPGHANVYAPGKRPFQTIIPAFVMKDGKPWLSFGVMGGGMQPQGHAQIICNMIDFGMGVQEAGDAARWQHEGSSEPTGEKMTDGGFVNLESGVPYESARELMNMGHDVRLDLGGYGGYQAIMRDHQQGVYYGASESGRTAGRRVLGSRIAPHLVVQRRFRACILYYLLVGSRSLAVNLRARQRPSRACIFNLSNSSVSSRSPTKRSSISTKAYRRCRPERLR
jgi:gamma-glutamyltranspeptidase/glutathione hydrolase